MDIQKSVVRFKNKSNIALFGNESKNSASQMATDQGSSEEDGGDSLLQPSVIQSSRLKNDIFVKLSKKHEKGYADLA